MSSVVRDCNANPYFMTFNPSLMTIAHHLMTFGHRLSFAKCLQRKRLCNHFVQMAVIKDKR